MSSQSLNHKRIVVEIGDIIKQFNPTDERKKEIFEKFINKIHPIFPLVAQLPDEVFANEDISSIIAQFGCSSNELIEDQINDLLYQLTLEYRLQNKRQEYKFLGIINFDKFMRKRYQQIKESSEKTEIEKNIEKYYYPILYMTMINLGIEMKEFKEDFPEGYEQFKD